MTDESALTGVVDGILTELEQVNDWMAELRADLVATGARRMRLAQAADAAVAALDPDERAPHQARLRIVLGEPDVRTGRPPADERFGFVLDLIAGWTGSTITTADVRLELDRHGLTGGKNYGSNLMVGLTRRGVLARTGYGRYRVVRMHPQLVERRGKLWQRMQERGLV